jgi:NADPH2:quinone reductase
MRALTFAAFGGPEVLQVLELPQPAPGAGEVVVRVAASPINPTDLLMRAGAQAALMSSLQPPYIGGMELAGLVHSVGAGVAGLTVGQAVMGVVNPRTPSGGTHAQFVRVPAASVAPLDASADLVSAATVPMNGLTALAALDALDLEPGRTLLVTGGAGFLASYVIQLAKARGLVVLADARATEHDRLRRLGVDEILPRGVAMAAAVRQRCAAGVDGLVDTALLGDPAAALVRDGGAAATLRKTHAITDPRVRHHAIAVVDQMKNTAALHRLVALWQAGALTTRIARRMSLSDAVAAHRLAEEGGLDGRVVFDMAVSA